MYEVAGVQIVDLKFLREFKIDILLSNGHRIIYDCGCKIHTARFKDIEDWEKFRAGRMADGRMIRWETGTELSLDEVLHTIR